MKRISETISMLKELDKGTLEGIRYTLFFFIVIDIFFFYWYMKWKSFGVAVLIVCCVILAVILLLERKFPDEETNKNKINPVFDKPEQETKGVFEMDIGLPNADDFAKRLDTAITT